MSIEDSIIEIDRNKEQRDKIIEYITKHPKCLKEPATRYGEKSGSGSRETMRKRMTELEKEGIICHTMEKGKRKLYQLTNVSYLSSIIPQNMREIYNHFENFIKQIIELLRKGKVKSRIRNSNIDLSDASHKQSLLLIPYYLIDIIKDVMEFYFTFTLPNQIPNNDAISQLQVIYNGIINRFLPYLSQKSKFFVLSNNHFDFVYCNHIENYLESSKYWNFEKICYVSNLCMMYEIDDKLFDVLDCLWIKYSVTVSRMYREFIDKALVYKERIDKHILDKLNSIDKHLIYNNDTLNKIHLSINQYVLNNIVNPAIDKS